MLLIRSTVSTWNTVFAACVINRTLSLIGPGAINYHRQLCLVKQMLMGCLTHFNSWYTLSRSVKAKSWVWSHESEWKKSVFSHFDLSRAFFFPKLGGVEEVKLWAFSIKWWVFLVKFLAMKMTRSWHVLAHKPAFLHKTCQLEVISLCRTLRM